MFILSAVWVIPQGDHAEMRYHAWAVHLADHNSETSTNFDNYCSKIHLMF